MNNFLKAMSSLSSMMKFESTYGSREAVSPLGPYDFSEITLLEDGLTIMKIPFKKQRLYDGWVIICDGWDAVLHCGSYGHEIGKLEIYGDIVQNEDDDVEGYLSAVDILLRL